MSVIKTLSILYVLLVLLTTCNALRPYHFTIHPEVGQADEQMHETAKDGEIGMEMYPTGSSLPDCSHACGSCAPCRRVMVSYTTCFVESCPVVYRCMCRGKFYHVPSN